MCDPTFAEQQCLAREHARRAGGASADGEVNKAQSALDAELKAHADGHLTSAAERYEKTLDRDPENEFAFTTGAHR